MNHAVVAGNGHGDTCFLQTLAIELTILPLLLLLALRRNRNVETRPDLLTVAKYQGSISLLHACLLFLIPLTAITVYALALASHFSFPLTGIFSLL